MNRQPLLGAALLLTLAACVIGAAATLAWILRFGLFAPRAPLSALGIGVRFAFLAAAVVLLVVRRDAFERVTLICAAVATASSFLFGLGVRSPALAAVRLVSHLLAYSLGAVAIIRLRHALERRNPSATNDIGNAAPPSSEYGA